MMKLGIVSSGRMANSFVKAVKNLEGLTIHSVYSRKMENGQQFANQYDIKQIYVDFDAFLADPQLEAVYIASVNSAHYQQTKQALLAGKHVLCEKPFTTSANQLRELIEIAQQQQLILKEAIIPLHVDRFQYLQAAVNRMTDIKMATFNFTKYSSQYADFKKGIIGNVFNPKLSGGALMDLNVYNLHLALSLFGQPNHMQYFANRAENGIDTSGIAILQYPTMIVNCIAGKDSNGDCLVQVQSETQTLTIQGFPSLLNGEVLIDNRVVLPKTMETEAAYDEGLRSEMSDFMKLVNFKEFSRSQKQLQHSLGVMEILSKLIGE